MKTYLSIFLRVCLLFILICLSSDMARGLSLDKVLRADGAAALRQQLQTEKRRAFLRALCAKRHLPGGKKSGPLAACYQLLSLSGGAQAPLQASGAGRHSPLLPPSQEAPRLSELDLLCLSLKVSDFDADLLRRSLQTKEISLICRRQLEEKLKILEYRKLDRLVPKLKGGRAGDLRELSGDSRDLLDPREASGRPAPAAALPPGLAPASEKSLPDPSAIQP